MTFFVLGAGGYLGRNLILDLASPGDRVIAVGRDRAPDSANAPFSQWLDVLDREHVEGPVAVVNTIAIADHGRCERDQSACDAVNHRLAAEIAEHCAEREVPLVHIGTDGLFGGSSSAPAYHTVDTPIVAINAYARAKSAAETALRKIGWGRVLRLSFVGPDLGTGRGLARFIADEARASVITGYDDIWFTAVHTTDVALAVRAEATCPGFAIRHVASFPAMTKYRFVADVVAALGFDCKVVATARKALPGGELVPTDQSLRADNPVPANAFVQRVARDVLEMRSTVKS